MTKNKPIRLTLAIAKDAPIGVVCVVMKAGLSRLFLWDTDTDTFTPGQFLKADAVIQSISSDGKYFGYTAYSHYRQPQRYVCIARPPYFTALAFFPTSSLSRAGINFADDSRVIVNADNDTSVPDEIKASCPFEVDRESMLRLAISSQCDDSRNKRFIWGEKDSVIEKLEVEGSERIIRTFDFEYFQGVETPDWARIW